jgi:acetylglutamate kinase
MDVKDPGSCLSSVSGSEIESMIEEQIISSGMMPKVESCVTALDGGTGKAHIIDGRIPHSLLLEIYTDKGVGTQITK